MACVGSIATCLCSQKKKKKNHNDCGSQGVLGRRSTSPMASFIFLSWPAFPLPVECAMRNSYYLCS